jgi:N-acylglucosamine 2-epimerase
MDKTQLKQTGEFYMDSLLNDVVPFWLEHGLDREHGGIMTGLNRDGSVIDSDKGCWQQGRFAWLMGHMYNNIEQNPEWLHAAESTINFIREHCRDPEDGRLFFHVTREGKPIRKRRYSFSESFASIAMAELAKAKNDPELAREATEMFKAYTAYNEQGATPPKFTETRPARGMVIPIIDMVTCQVLRDTIDMPGATYWIEM